MFSRSQYKPPPLDWSRRPLTHWDCCQFGRNDSPVIGWVVSGNIDLLAVFRGLDRAVRRRASWLGGRLARTESGCPLFEIHVPPTDSNIASFTTSVDDVQTKLGNVIPYVRDGSPQPIVNVLESFNKTVLNPRTAIAGVEDYIEQNLPLLHVHVIKALDATFISLCWSHAAMDAVGAAQIVKAWDGEINGIDATATFEDPDPATLFDFTKTISLSSDWVLPGWLRPNFREIVWLVLWVVYETLIYPQAHGSIYIPEGVVKLWKSTAEQELGKDEWVSRNDLVEAWVFKHGWSWYPDGDFNTMFTAINFRGRHPLLPKTAITNTAKSYVTPSFTTLELKTMSLSQIARRLRKSTDSFSDPNYVAEVVTDEYNNMKLNNGKVRQYPLGTPGSRLYGATSWAKLGFSSLKFGTGAETIATLTYCSDRRCSTLVDGQCGDWRIDLKLSKRAWDCLQIQAEKERQAIERN